MGTCTSSTAESIIVQTRTVNGVTKKITTKESIKNGKGHREVIEESNGNITKTITNFDISTRRLKY